MISYTMVGTRDLARAIAFYNPIFEAMGLDICWRDERESAWGRADDDRVPRFYVTLPFDGKMALFGNGAMTAFRVETENDVATLHKLAMRGGATCEGRPGARPQYGDTFFAAYVRDLDGNKIAFVRF